MSARLGIKDSDLFRFSVKLSLSQMVPLLQQDSRGIDLLLAILESGRELLRYFEFDTHQIDRIVNADVEFDRRVSRDDIDLVAVAASNEGYLATRLRALGQPVGAGEDPLPVLRRYLYNKYFEERCRLDQLSGCSEFA